MLHEVKDHIKSGCCLCGDVMLRLGSAGNLIPPLQSSVFISPLILLCIYNNFKISNSIKDYKIVVLYYSFNIY